MYFWETFAVNFYQRRRISEVNVCEEKFVIHGMRSTPLEQYRTLRAAGSDYTSVWPSRERKICDQVEWGLFTTTQNKHRIGKENMWPLEDCSEPETSSTSDRDLWRKSVTKAMLYTLVYTLWFIHSGAKTPTPWGHSLSLLACWSEIHFYKVIILTLVLVQSGKCFSTAST